jgi:hypothetical protein
VDKVLWKLLIIESFAKSEFFLGAALARVPAGH